MCYSEHLWTFLSGDIGFLASGMELLSHVCVSLREKMPSHFLELFSFCIPAVNEPPCSMPVPRAWCCISPLPSCWVWSMVSVGILFAAIVVVVVVIYGFFFL